MMEVVTSYCGGVGSSCCQPIRPPVKKAGVGRETDLVHRSSGRSVTPTGGVVIFSVLHFVFVLLGCDLFGVRGVLRWEFGSVSFQEPNDVSTLCEQKCALNTTWDVAERR